jgi:hypothetical protein
LPFSAVRFSLWKFGRVGRCIEQGNKLPAIRQHNRIVEIKPGFLCRQWGMLK